MDTGRVINLLLRLGLRYGAKALSKRNVSDPKLAKSAKKLRIGRRLGRF